MASFLILVVLTMIVTISDAYFVKYLGTVSANSSITF